MRLILDATRTSEHQASQTSPNVGKEEENKFHSHLNNFSNKVDAFETNDAKLTRLFRI